MEFVFVWYNLLESKGQVSHLITITSTLKETEGYDEFADDNSRDSER